KSLQASQVATETAQIYDSEAMLVISSSLNLGGLVPAQPHDGIPNYFMAVLTSWPRIFDGEGIPLVEITLLITFCARLLDAS
ncbi:MAG: hypothetical protein ACI802_003228, partial [Candidatus Paceibacteria bacterium]